MKPEDEGKGNAALLHKSKTRRKITMSKKVNLVLAGLVFAVLAVFLTLTGFADAGQVCDPPVETRADGCSGCGDFCDFFKSSCNEHDICYATLGKKQYDCDVEFGNKMAGQCDARYGEWYNTTNRHACYAAKDAMYNAVRAGGGSSYKNGQDWAKKHCQYGFIKYR